jgi:ABC-type oligopeptide transport system substrate-binding subunit
VKTVFRLIVCVLIVMLAVPSMTGIAIAQDGEKTLVTAYGVGDPHSIDPQLGIDTRDATLFNQLFPGLTWLNEETREVELAMAASYDVSDDGTVYTFRLLEDVPWCTIMPTVAKSNKSWTPTETPVM